jgi:hypothetical protein
LAFRPRQNKKPFRTKVWPVLAREKNSQKETLLHSKNQVLSNLPLSIKITGPAKPAKAEWTPNSAWANLIQSIELKLKEKILRYKLNISEQPQLEWILAGRAEQRRDGMHHPSLH